MKVTKTELHHSRIRSFLNSGEVQAAMLKYCENIAAAAGPGYYPSVQPGDARAQGSVFTETEDAVIENSRYNTLLKAINAA